MTLLFRLLLLVCIFVGAFQAFVRAREVVLCVSPDEPPTVRIRKMGCETRGRQVSSQRIPFWHRARITVNDPSRGRYQ